MIEFIDNFEHPVRFDSAHDIVVVGEKEYLEGIKCFIETKQGVHIILNDHYSILQIMKIIVGQLEEA